MGQVAIRDGEEEEKKAMPIPTVPKAPEKKVQLNVPRKQVEEVKRTNPMIQRAD